jgi:hypothetical protein
MAGSAGLLRRGAVDGEIKGKDMNNIIKFYPKNAAENPNAVLEQAIDQYQDVLIIGYDKDGELQARSTNRFADGGELLWIIENLKKNLLDGVYE